MRCHKSLHTTFSIEEKVLLIIKNVSIFDGNSIQKNKTVIASNKKIIDIKPSFNHITHSSKNTKIIEGHNNLLIPGFIDVQVNGGGGCLFNKNPTTNSLKKIFTAHLKYGTTSFFPTVLSDTYEITKKAISTVGKQIGTQKTGVVGIHLEGPFLNVMKKGIHPTKHIKLQSDEYLKLFLKTTISKKLITIAPEMLNKEAIAELIKSGFYTFSGHTNAHSKEMQKYFKMGISGITHLFNACSQISARDVGVVGASLLNPKIMSTLIVDNHHVSDDALKIAFKLKDAKKFMLISDAMELIGTTKKSFKLFGEMISLKDKLLKNQSNTLAGAHLTMLWAFQNLLKKKLVSQHEAMSMTSSNQAEFFGLKNKGAILPNYDANMVLINKNDFKLLKVIFYGKLV